MTRFWDKENKYLVGYLKEYKYWILEISFRQHTLGSVIIFCKRNIERITDLTKEEFSDLQEVMKEYGLERGVNDLKVYIMCEIPSNVILAEEEKMAIITMAPRSSIIARIIRNTFRAGGTLLPRRAMTPRAKAISVAAGIAQPFKAAGSPILIKA